MVKWLRRIRASKFASRNHPLTSAMDIVFWWEARRPAFNLLVGVTGILTCIAIVAIGLAFDQLHGPDPELMLLPDPPIFAIVGVIGYGIAANICYTGGWIVELLVRWTWPEESHQLATLSFTLGLVVAVLVTLLPIPLFAAMALLILLVG